MSNLIILCNPDLHPAPGARRVNGDCAAHPCKRSPSYAILTSIQLLGPTESMGIAQTTAPPISEALPDARRCPEAAPYARSSVLPGAPRRSRALLGAFMGSHALPRAPRCSEVPRSRPLRSLQGAPRRSLTLSGAPRRSHGLPCAPTRSPTIPSAPRPDPPVRVRPPDPTRPAR